MPTRTIQLATFGLFPPMPHQRQKMFSHLLLVFVAKLSFDTFDQEETYQNSNLSQDLREPLEFHNEIVKAKVPF